MYPVVKRIVDFLVSMICILLMSPVFIVLIILIKLDSRGPVFFSQKRIGKDKRHFMIYKFRTMKIDTPRDVPTHLLQNPQQYITRVGRFLRKFSLDELPQIYNILRGDMSFVGPRPALWNQFDLIEQRDRVSANKVLPGLTGWAQINGRDELPISIKAQYDGEYVNRMSLLFDIQIVFMTVKHVLTGAGVSA